MDPASATTLTFSDYLRQAARAYYDMFDADNDASWRMGQTYFNVLFQQRPELANAIRTTELDPFYDDSRLPKMLTWLERHW